MKTKGVIVDKDTDGIEPMDVEVQCQGEEVRIDFWGRRGFQLRLRREDLTAALADEEHG